MGNILDKIIEDKYIEVAQRKEVVSLDEMKARAEVKPKCRNFYKAVTKKNPRGLNVISEVKKASPSAGLIRADFDPVQIAKTYAGVRGGCDKRTDRREIFSRETGVYLAGERGGRAADTSERFYGR